jgi:hypothetical protein
MVKNRYGSSYEEEEGYYKKGKGKKHEGGKFAVSYYIAPCELKKTYFALGNQHALEMLKLH